MRERRRKKRKLNCEQPIPTKHPSDAAPKFEEDQKENPQDDQIVGKRQPITLGKRKMDEVSTGKSSSKTTRETESSITNQPELSLGENTMVKIRLPSSSTSYELKKFRKDWRRKVRRKYPGIREENIIFHEDSCTQEPMQVIHINAEEETDANTSQDNKTTKQRKKLSSFPRINDILAQQKLAAAAEKEREKRLEKEKEIPAEEKNKYVALDCEMVGVGMAGKKSALARVSIVNWDCETLLDTYVTVPERVTDFRTWVSGVRPKDIQLNSNKNQQNVIELNACRSLVGNLIKDKVVVGHALKNDFQALMLDHPKTHVRDTARYRPFMRHIGKQGGKHRPRKLRDLAEEKLGRKIQVQGESHSSVDDAIAAMELYKLERTKWENEVAKKNKKKLPG